jgi:hypothetical protein
VHERDAAASTAAALGKTEERKREQMPRTMQRQEAPVEEHVVGRAPSCIACGNRRLFWVQRDDQIVIARAWEIRPKDRLLACGRCRARNTIVFEAAEG